ncbi:MAG: NADH-quinone oxidoreductase subunit A [Candidatus Methylomirabilis sp.]|nr:NADH-quinone oxidoreductase subunit A [Deltaproteobacteria bacterium]
MTAQYIPILVLLVIAIGFCIVFLGLSHLLGPKRATPGKVSQYECGMPPSGTARERFHVKYSMVAILFVVFDVETVFLYPWAVRFDALGWYGFVAMTIFLLVLTAGLAYEWKRGAMKWQ